MRSLGESFLVVAARLQAVFTEAAAREGLTFTEARALRYLADPDVQVQDLERLLECRAARVSWLLGQLERREFVVRSNADHDRRVRVVTVTPAGTRAVKRLSKSLDASSPLQVALTEDERDVLEEMLRRMGGED